MNQFEHQGYIAASQGKEASENPHAGASSEPLEAFSDWAQGWEWWHVEQEAKGLPVQAAKPVHM